MNNAETSERRMLTYCFESKIAGDEWSRKREVMSSIEQRLGVSVTTGGGKNMMAILISLRVTIPKKQQLYPNIRAVDSPTIPPPSLMSAAKEIRRPIAATIRLTVPAGAARPAPPVGPALGQYRLNLMAFCKDFNARTQKYKADTPMAVTITAYKDNTFEFVVKSPSVTWFLKKAAGIESGSSRPGHVVSSSITLRHVYEIAKLKQTDPYCQFMGLESICKSIIGTANSMGIKVVKDLVD
ncbi:hypothetical protein KSP39_PZI023191 [Platanthera zijinensis]|uniref:Large ribosomal subunit protein uL11m n=1 Tax=Platanthera zijinensis TaxID=2320716 RepID=A0AAP0AUT8_9ASPA